MPSVSPDDELQTGLVATAPAPELQSVLDAHLQVDVDESPAVKTPAELRHDGRVLSNVQEVVLPHLQLPASQTFELPEQVTLSQASAMKNK